MARKAEFTGGVQVEMRMAGCGRSRPWSICSLRDGEGAVKTAKTATVSCADVDLWAAAVERMVATGAD